MTNIWDSVLHSKTTTGRARGRPKLRQNAVASALMSAPRPEFYFCPSDDDDNESVIDMTASHSSHWTRGVSGRPLAGIKHDPMSASYPPPIAAGAAETTSHTADALQNWIRQWLSTQPAPGASTSSPNGADGHGDDDRGSLSWVEYVRARVQNRCYSESVADCEMDAVNGVFTAGTDATATDMFVEFIHMRN